MELCVLRQEEDPMQTVSLCRLCYNSLKLSWTKIWKTQNGGKTVSATTGRPKLLFEQILHISKNNLQFHCLTQSRPMVRRWSVKYWRVKLDGDGVKWTDRYLTCLDHESMAGHMVKKVWQLTTCHQIESSHDYKVN